MKLKNYYLTSMLLLVSITVFAQYGMQKKADKLFNSFAFADAKEVYTKLIHKDFNADYATRQLADSYAFMRNPDSAVVYYQKAVEQENIPIEYYYNYAQALRGVKDYKGYRNLMKRYKNEGGIINEDQLTNDKDFLKSVLNAKQQYFLTDVKFNSKFSDFGAIEHDGNIYFTSARDEGVLTKHRYGWNEEPFLDIYVTEKNANDSLIDYKSKLKGDINSVFHDGPITITKDGKTIYFSRNDFNKNVLGKNDEGITNLKIYRATLIDGKWKNIEDLSINSSSYSTGHPALNNDESKLYFASDMSGGFGGSDIYYVSINNDSSLGEPINAGKIVNTNKNEKFPFLNKEDVLFFSSDGHQGLGLLDIFATVSDKDKNINNVINLGVPVNSSKDDFSFFLNENGLSGYFASNRDGGVGSDDIYAFDKTPQLKIEGAVKDGETNLPLQNAKINLLDTVGNIIAFVETDSDGHFDINIDRDTDYILQVIKDGYTEQSRNTTSTNTDKKTSKIIEDFILNKIEDDKIEPSPIIKLAPIYFDFDKATIRNQDTSELNEIIDLMNNKHPKMAIRIESFTDSRGPAKYNKGLSIKRSKSTYDYLIKNGVDKNRIISYDGYGEERLVNNCDGSIKCTEAQHQLNRRTEFIVSQME
ncbi:OmpA family protein [Algibacter sp. L4_22]|uniref:OmpA family protein n=1 Tax=Algibacter sp. L4_22 TaxID=2942477 RepID=UPI00201B95F6|nr:OmpA family protein [Algibacter sp. L4_22]MCL5128078.1 OmpA family protein [Algibacter sp. L4_22]